MSDTSTMQNSIILELLNKYSNYLSGSVIPLRSFCNAVRILSAIFNRIIDAPYTDSLNSVWDFFVLHKSDILHVDIVMQGVHGVSAENRLKFLTIYSRFCQAVVGDVVIVTDPIIVDLFNCATLITFLQTKAATVAAEFSSQLLATQGYVDSRVVSAVHTETTRAETAESLLALSGGGISPTEPVITSTGTWLMPFSAVITAPSILYIKGVGMIVPGSGVSFAGIYYQEPNEAVGGLTSLSFSNLVVVGEMSINISAPLLESLEFPNLFIISSSVNIYSGSIASMDFPSLRSIQGDFNLYQNGLLLSEISFPELIMVGSNLYLQAGATSISAPNLVVINGMFLPPNEGLETVDFSSLTRVISFYWHQVGLTDGHTTPSIRFPALTTITGGDLDIYSLYSATGLEFPVLAVVYGSCLIGDLRSLSAAFEMPALTAVYGNIALNFIRSTAISMPLLQSVTGTFTCDGNSGTTTDFSSLTAVGGTLDFEANAFSSLLFSALTTVGGDVLIFTGDGASTTTIDLSALVNVGGSITVARTTGTDIPLLTTISLAALENVQSVELRYGSGSSDPTTFSFGPNLKILNGTLTIASPLDQASVDGIFASLVALDGTGETQNWAGILIIDDTSPQHAFPSSTGLANIDILRSRGATITCTTS